MVSVPAPRKFQYMARSTIIFLHEALGVILMETLPERILSLVQSRITSG